MVHTQEKSCFYSTREKAEYFSLTGIVYVYVYNYIIKYFNLF